MSHILFERIKTNSILHLGCGSGLIDYHLKDKYNITGLDLSKHMIQSAIARNPECSYMTPNMINFSIKSKFDAIIIPDAIEYLLSETEMLKLFTNAKRHLIKMISGHCLTPHHST